MKQVVKLTENDITNLVMETLNEVKPLKPGDRGSYWHLLRSTISNKQQPHNNNQRNNENLNMNQGLTNEERQMVSEAMADCNMEEAVNEFNTALRNVASRCNNQNLNNYISAVYNSWNNLLDNCVAD